MREQGYCTVIRTELCARQASEAAATFLGIKHGAMGAIPAGQGIVRFEVIWFNDGVLIPTTARIVARSSIRLWKRVGDKYVEVEEPVKCVEFDEHIMSLINELSARSLCSNTLSGKSLVKNLESGKACIVDSEVFARLVNELTCVIRCFKQRGGKSYFDFFLAWTRHGELNKALLIEVKADRDDARKLIAARTFCINSCKLQYVDVTVVYVDIQLQLTKIKASIHGFTDLILHI